MQPVLDVSSVRELEAALIDGGVGEDVLMQRAGAVVAAQAAQFVEGGSVVVFCGMGNNAGDGWVVADRLAAAGLEVAAVCPAAPALMKGDLARRMADRAVEMGIPVHVGPSREEVEQLLAAADVVVDAVFGTGFHGAMGAPYSIWVDAVDEAFAGMVVSIDVPSGVDADTGEVVGPCFEADLTVTMFALKPGLLSGEGRLASGTVAVAALASAGEGMPDLAERSCFMLTADEDHADVLPPLDPTQDKYGRGRVLVIGGSARYPGAAIMAARAASRSGAGYVTLAVPSCIASLAQGALPDVVVAGLACDEGGSFSPEAAEEARALAARCDAVLAGPGATVSFGACEVVRALLAEQVPLVLDADALGAAVKICCGSVLDNPSPLRRDAPLVLTPHRGELARLVGRQGSSIASLLAAVEAAQSIVWAVGSGDLCVLAKGPQTAAVCVDGALVAAPGPASLATAGSGDVLAGMLAGTLAVEAANAAGERIDSSDLVRTVCAVDRAHALAGELAVERFGARGVVATDLLDLVGVSYDELDARSEAALERIAASGEPLGRSEALCADPPFDDPGPAEPSAAQVHLPAPTAQAGPDGPHDRRPTSSSQRGGIGPDAPSADVPPPAAPQCPEPLGLTLVEPGFAPADPSSSPSESRVPSVEAGRDRSGGDSVPPFLAKQGWEGGAVATALDAAGDYHENATLRIGDPAATPLEERPSARTTRQHRLRGGND